VFTFHDSAYFPPVTRVRQFFDPGNGNTSYGEWVSGFHLSEDDAMTSVGDAGGRGAFLLDGDGNVSINGLAQERIHREMAAGQNIPVGVNTPVREWTTVIADSTHFTYDNLTGDFTCTTPGTWLCVATVKFNNSGTEDDGIRRLFFDQAPGPTFGQGSAITNSVWSDTFVTGTGMASFAVGDVLNVVVRTQGADADLLSGGDTMLQMHRLAA
jgi:hypothetical protein